MLRTPGVLTLWLGHHFPNMTTSRKIKFTDISCPSFRARCWKDQIGLPRPAERSARRPQASSTSQHLRRSRPCDPSLSSESGCFSALKIQYLFHTNFLKHLLMYCLFIAAQPLPVDKLPSQMDCGRFCGRQTRPLCPLPSVGRPGVKCFRGHTAQGVRE